MTHEKCNPSSLNQVVLADWLQIKSEKNCLISKMFGNHHMFGYFKMFHAIFHNKHSFGSRSTVCQQADEVLSNPAKRICIQKCQKKAAIWSRDLHPQKSQHGTPKSQEFTIGKSCIKTSWNQVPWRFHVQVLTELVKQAGCGMNAWYEGMVQEMLNQGSRLIHLHTTDVY